MEYKDGDEKTGNITRLRAQATQRSRTRRRTAVLLMEPQTWAQQIDQRRKIGTCDQQQAAAMTCGWGLSRRAMTKKVLLQRHRVQIGEGSGPRKERLESQEGLQHHHHPLAPYPGDQREQHHQHSYHREGKEHGGQQGGVEGGSAAVGSAVSRDDCRATAFEASVSRMEVKQSDPSTANNTAGSSTTGQRDSGSTTTKHASPARASGKGAEDGGNGKGAAAATTAERLACSPLSKESRDAEELIGTAGGASNGDVAAPGTITVATSGAAWRGSGGGATLSVAPSEKGLVSAGRPSLDVVIPGRMAAKERAAETSPAAVIVAPSAGVADSRDDASGVRKDDVIVEVDVTEEGDAVYAFNKSAPARRGKWSRLEEEYANRIISDFDEGVLDAAPGVSLRTLLASKLHCDVMRVSKKFKGWACVGKRSFRPVHHLDGRTAKAKDALLRMEQAWLRSITSGSNGRGHLAGAAAARKNFARGFGPPPSRTAQERCHPADSQRQEMPSEDNRGGGDGGRRHVSAHDVPLQTQQQQQRSWLAARAADQDRARVISLEVQEIRGHAEPGTSSATSPASRASPRHVGPPMWPPASGSSSSSSSAANHGGVGHNNGWAQYRQEGRGAPTTSRPSSAPQVSSGHVHGSAPLGDQPAVARPGHYWEARARGGPDGVVSSWQRDQEARLHGGGGGGGGGDSDTDLYPVYKKLGRARSDGNTGAEAHQMALPEERHPPYRRNENNAREHARDVERRFVGSSRDIMAPMGTARMGGISSEEHGRPVGGAIKTATTTTTERESRPEFPPPRVAPLAPSSREYQLEGCDRRFAAEDKIYLPAVRQAEEEQHHQQHPAKLRRIMGCFSHHSNGAGAGGGSVRADDGGRPQKMFRDSRRLQRAASQDYDQQRQWEQRWPETPRAYRKESATATNHGGGHRLVLSGRPLLRLSPESRSARQRLSFPPGPPPPIASFPFPRRDDMGNGNAGGRQGSAEGARPGRVSLKHLPFSDASSPSAGVPRRHSFPPHPHFRGSGFPFSQPEACGGGGAVVVVAPSSEHRSAVVGFDGEHNSVDDRDHGKSAQFSARSLPALVRRISVGNGLGAGRGVVRN